MSAVDPPQYRFEVALSFAGDEKRDKVRQVAELLQQKLGVGKVFFDEWFEAELAGHDAQKVLQNIYWKSTRLVVSCVCKRYNEKPWTQAEWRAIEAFEVTLRAGDAGGSDTERLRFLPLRFGDGEVDGLFPTAIVPDVRDREPEEIAKLILDRWRLTQRETQEVGANRERLRASVVAIGNPGVGAGVIVSHNVIVTCAHVVSDAGAGLGDTVTVSFPGMTGRQARVHPKGWRPPNEENLALLQLLDPLPPGIEPLLLGSSAGLEGHLLVGGGFAGPEAKLALARVTGQIAGPVAGTYLLQLDSQEMRPRFSGGPLLDESRGHVIGLIQAALPGAAQPTVAIPMETVAGVVTSAHLDGATELRALGEQLSASLLPRAGWTPLTIVDEPLVDSAAAGLADALKACASLEGKRPHLVLSRLPIDLADQVVRRLEGNADRNRWAQALVHGCATRVGGLALLAAALAELEPWRMAQPVRDFAARVAAQGRSTCSEITVREALERAAPLELNEVKNRARAAGAAESQLAALEAVAPCHRVTWTVRFLTGLRPSSNGASPLQEFIAGLAGPALPSAEGGPSFLTVTIQKGQDGLYGAEIWRRVGDAPWPKLAVEGVTEEGLRQAIGDARDSLGEASAASDQLVEFILPRDLALLGVERWRVKFGLRPAELSARCTVVVRSWERLYDRTFRRTRGDWVKKWHQFVAGPELRCLEDLGADADARFDAMGNPDVGGIVITATPEPLLPEGDWSGDDPIALCLNAGIPVMLWPRTAAGIDMRSLAKEMPKNAREVLAWLRKHRASQTMGARDVTLLWDDVDRLPPDLVIAYENVGERRME